MAYKTLIVFISAICFAECDFSEEIKKNPDGSYTYSKNCHLYVGDMVRDLELRKQQIDNYKQIIELKDLVIKDHISQTAIWKTTSENLNGRLNTISRYQTYDRWFHFGLGVALSAAAVYGASKLTK